jgi:hypothetical protein
MARVSRQDSQWAQEYRNTVLAGIVNGPQNLDAYHFGWSVIALHHDSLCSLRE